MTQLLLDVLKKNYPQVMAPFSQDKPCGECIYHTEAFDQLKDLQHKAAQGQTVEWSAVATQCLDVLASTSKDLHVMAWLTGAWMRQQGLDGMVQGLTLIHYFLELYWDHLYPAIQQDHTEHRLAPFLWLDTKMPGQLRFLPLYGTLAEAHDTYGDWCSARARAKNKKTTAYIVSHMLQLPSQQLLSQKNMLSDVIEIIGNIDRVLLAQSILQSPWTKFPKTIKNIAAIYTKVIKKQPEPKPATPEALNRQTALLPVPVDASLSSVTICSREHAYVVLNQVAHYLEQTEPHSPTPHLIRRAIHWGALSLGELLNELFASSNGNIKQVLTLLGLDEKDKEKKTS